MNKTGVIVAVVWLIGWLICAPVATYRVSSGERRAELVILSVFWPVLVPLLLVMVWSDWASEKAEKIMAAREARREA